MLKDIIINTLYILALINPVSKISILSVFTSEEGQKNIIPISIRASIVSILILILSMLAGEFILNKVFHVNFFSLKIAGGIVLFWVGFGALRKGVFFEHTTHEKFSDISLVPLACPMIAGPATITAVIALNIKEGVIQTAIPTLFAILINLVLMLLSVLIGKALSKFNILGALIRLTGLIIIAIGIQMALEGVSMWLKILRNL